MSEYRRYFVKGGIYFFTLVLQDRSKDWLTRYIQQFKEAYKETLTHYPFETIAITILPDHLHWIMKLPDGDDNFARRIQLLKINFSKRLPANLKNPNLSQQKKNELGIWQRRYWEHNIRDEQDLEKHLFYTYYNPVKHGYVKSVSDWQYSSFHRDVKQGLIEENWGKFVPNEIYQLYME